MFFKYQNLFISLTFQGGRSPYHPIMFLKDQNVFISLTLQGFPKEERGRSRPCCRRFYLIHFVEYNKLDSRCLQSWWFHSTKGSAQGSPHSCAMAHPQASITLCNFKTLLDKCKRHSRGCMYKIPQRKMELKVWVMCQRRR